MYNCKVKIIIASYNGEYLIRDCLNSLKKNTIKLQVIVIDNASTDKTAEIIEKEYPEVRLIKNQKNEGFGRANNIGMQIALKENIDYVLLLNQDATIEPDTIEKLINIHKKEPEYGILSPLHLDENEYVDGRFLSLMFRENNKIFQEYLLNKNKKELYDVSWVNAAAWLIPIKILKEIGGFNPQFFMYGEDADYCKRVKYHKYKVGILLNSRIIHTRHNVFFNNYGFWKNLKRDIFDVKQYYNEQFLSLNYSTKQNFKSETRHFYKYMVNHLAFFRLREIVSYSLGYTLFLFNIKKMNKLRKRTMKKGGHFLVS